MRLTRGQKFLAWFVAAIGITVAAFVIGGSLKPVADPHYLFDLDAPAYQADLRTIAATSQGGFTGFGDSGGGDDRTVLGGRVVEVSAASLTLETPTGVRTTLRLGATSRLSRLETASRDQLQPGATVIVVRGEQDGEATAVLVVSQP